MSTTPAPAFKIIKRYPDGRLRSAFGLASLKDLRGSSGRYVYEIARYDAEAGRYRASQIVAFGHHAPHLN